MKAIIKDIKVEGTPEEIAKLIALSYPEISYTPSGSGFSFSADPNNSYKWKNYIVPTPPL